MSEWKELLAAGPLRVLVVDDDEAHAEAIGDSLEMDGCIVRVEGSGQAGVAALAVIELVVFAG